MLLCFSLASRAQDAPKVEGFAGFSAMAVAAEGEGEHAFGWQGSVAGNFHPNIGIVADFGGQYKSIDIEGTDISVRAHEFLFGPQFNARLEKANPFVHVLFGGANGRAAADSESVSRTVFMMGIGGGVDVNAGDRMAIRLIQFDWLPIHTEGEWFNKIVRVSIGIVFKGGQ